MSIEIQGLTKKFGNFAALKEVNLKVETGELLALLGPSGSGKTTLLRIIAGLEFADEGKVLFHGDNIAGQKASDRKVGFVFQHYALFKHMSVFDNVAFGLNVRNKKDRPSKEEIKKKVSDLLKLVRLDGMASRYPSQLSGGQRQRVALARALAIEPKMLLLDEPFGALDAKVRKELRQWLRDLHDKLHMTSVFVTHDQEEALEVADRIVVMNEGRIEQIGTPDEVYHKPATPFVYNFLGNVNLFHCRLDEGQVLFGKSVPEASSGKGNAKVYIRPHLLDVSREAQKNSFKAKVRTINAAGATVRVDLISEWGDQVSAEIPHEVYKNLNLKREEEVFVTPKQFQVFSEEYTI